MVWGKSGASDRDQLHAQTGVNALNQIPARSREKRGAKRPSAAFGTPFTSMTIIAKRFLLTLAPLQGTPPTCARSKSTPPRPPEGRKPTPRRFEQKQEFFFQRTLPCLKRASVTLPKQAWWMDNCNLSAFSTAYDSFGDGKTHQKPHQDPVRALGEFAQREQGIVVLQDHFPRAVGAHHGVEQEGWGQVVSECLQVPERRMEGVGQATSYARCLSRDTLFMSVSVRCRYKRRKSRHAFGPEYQP